MAVGDSCHPLHDVRLAVECGEVHRLQARALAVPRGPIQPVRLAQRAECECVVLLEDLRVAVVLVRAAEAAALRVRLRLQQHFGAVAAAAASSISVHDRWCVHMRAYLKGIGGWGE